MLYEKEARLTISQVAFWISSVEELQGVSSFNHNVCGNYKHATLKTAQNKLQRSQVTLLFIAWNVGGGRTVEPVSYWS